MPMGPTPLAFGYYTGIKAIGYTAAAIGLNRIYENNRASSIKVGLVRTGIGVGVGVSYGIAWFFIADKLHINGDAASIAFMTPLFPIRLVEWGLLIKIFYDGQLSNRSRLWKCSIAGTVWSYCLDAIGIAAAWVLPGGIWVC